MRSVMPKDWTLPAVTPANQAFFTSGRMVLQSCMSCRTVQHPPEDVCHNCQATEFEGCESEGIGSVYSYTVVHHPPHPALAKSVPYAVVLVSLDDFTHVRITGNLLGLPPDRVSIGLRVRAVWEEVEGPDGTLLRLPQWEALES